MGVLFYQVPKLPKTLKIFGTFFGTWKMNIYLLLFIKNNTLIYFEFNNLKYKKEYLLIHFLQVPKKVPKMVKKMEKFEKIFENFFYFYLNFGIFKKILTNFIIF